MSTRFTAVRIPCLFNDRVCTYYYRDGQPYGEYTTRPRLYHPFTPENVLTRAQGFRYWAKHFPDRACYTLPKALQDAIDRKPVRHGTYRDRSGKIQWYES